MWGRRLFGGTPSEGSGRKGILGRIRHWVLGTIEGMRRRRANALSKLRVDSLSTLDSMSSIGTEVLLDSNSD